MNLKESVKTAQEKLAKAKAVCLPLFCIQQARIYLLIPTQFIKAQDKLFKEQHAASATSAPVRLGTCPLPLSLDEFRRVYLRKLKLVFDLR